MLAAELINSLFNQAGITDQTDLQTKLAQVKDLASIDVPDDVATKLIGKDRMSLEAAKNNTDLKTHFTALALNGVDAETNNIITTYGLNPEDFAAEKSSYKKLSLAAQKLEEKLKADLGKGKTDNKELIDQINAVKAEKAAIETDYQANIEELNNQHSGEINKMMVNNMLGSYKYAHDLPIEDNILVASNKIHSELASKGLKYVRQNGGFELQKEDGTKYFDGNKEVTFKDFTDTVLSSNKLLATNDPKPQPTPAPITGSNGNDKGWGAYAAKAEAAAQAAV